MKCPKCGTKNLANSRFCGVCRYPLHNFKVSHAKDITVALIAFITIILTVQVFATVIIALLEIAINYQLANGENQLFGSVTETGEAAAKEIDFQESITLLILSFFSSTIITRCSSTFVVSKYAKIIISPGAWLTSIGVHWYIHNNFYQGFLFKVITDLDTCVYATLGIILFLSLISIALKLRKSPKVSSSARKNVAALFIISFLFIDFVYIPSTLGEDLKESHQVYVDILKSEQEMRDDLTANYDKVVDTYNNFSSIYLFNNSSEGSTELQKISNANNVSLVLINEVLDNFEGQVNKLAEKANMSELDIFYVELSGDRSIYTLVGMVVIGIEIGSTALGIAEYSSFLASSTDGVTNLSEYQTQLKNNAQGVKNEADLAYQEFLSFKNKNVSLLDEFLEEAIDYLDQQVIKSSEAWDDKEYYEVALRSYVAQDLSEKLSYFYDSATSNNASIGEIFENF